MLELIIISLIILIIISFGLYKYFKYHMNNNLKKEYISNKIDRISNNIKGEISMREDKPYYDSLKSILNEYPVINDNTDDNLIKLSNRLLNIDALYVDLKFNFRSLDEFETFQCKFNYQKKKYKQIFNKSLEVVDLMEKEYSHVIEKYLFSFNSDFNSIKENEINSLNKLVKESKNVYNKYDLEVLKPNLKEINKIHLEIYMKIGEPGRLRDKLLKSEDNISQLETELINIKGTLYYKVLDIIKNSKVMKEDTDEWNRIKRTINNFRKSSLLKNDVIESSDKLNKIIQNLSNLSDKINKEIGLTDSTEKVNLNSIIDK